MIAMGLASLMAAMALALAGFVGAGSHRPARAMHRARAY